MRERMYPIIIHCILLGCSASKPTAVDFVAEYPSLAPHASYFVTTDGSRTGDGTRDHPWALETALAQPGIVKPGDTIWLRGGVYRGEYLSDLSGIPSAPVVLRQYPGERAIIDGRLTIRGHNAFYWGFEVTYSDPRRITGIAGSDPADLPREHMTIFVSGPFNKLINLIVHDMGDGVFAGSPAEGLEIYGSVFFNNGWQGPDRGHGHNLYLQNQGATKLVMDNILFNSFSSGLQIYGSAAAYLRNFQIEGNTIFNSGDPVASRFGLTFEIEQWGGAPGGLGRSVYRYNSIYDRDAHNIVVRFNVPGGTPGDDIEFSHNIVHGSTNFNEMKSYTVTGNKFTSGTAALSGQNVLIGLRMQTGLPYSVHKWDTNQYAVPALGSQDPFYVVNRNGMNFKFPTWQAATGYDRASTFVSGQFSRADVIIRPNRYEPGRAFITCWNWGQASELSVNPSAVLKPGDHFEIRHIFGILGPALVSGVYTGASIRIPQPVATPPAPLGLGAAVRMPDDRFNVFLLQKQ